MNHPESPPEPFRLHQWVVQPNLNRVDGPEGPVQIEPRVMAVLLCLAARPGEVVSRLEILDEVWSGSVVGEEILTRAVSELRRVFGDNARKPSFIETIRQSGYRLIAPVLPVAEPVPSQDPRATDKPEPDAPRGRSGSWVRLLVVAVILVVLAVVIPRLVTRPATRSDAPAPVEAVPLTTFPGREFHPALSPDGTRVAFAWSGPAEGRTAIHIKQCDSEATLQLTDEPGWAAWPAWAPDGQALAFVQTADSVSALGLVPSLGGAVRWLHRVAGLVEGLDWSPDGSRLVFAAHDTLSGRFRLFQLDLADKRVATLGFERSDIAGDISPHFSPDGGQLAWIGLNRAGGSTLFVGPAAGGTARAVVSYLTPLQGLAWAPDGQSVVYAAAEGGVYRLWHIAIQGGSPRLIPTPGEFAWNPTIARATGDLVFEQVRVDQDIWRVSIAARDPWQVTSEPFLASTRWESEAEYRPDGQAIALVSNRSGTPEIWLSDAEGRQPRPLTESHATAIANLRWSFDGKAIACNATIAGESRVILVDAELGTIRDLSPQARQALFVGWGAAGRTLLVAVPETEGGWQVHRWDLTGRDMGRITRAGALTAQESESGRVLYFTRPDRPGLWRRVAGGRVTPELVLSDLMPVDRFNWRLDGDRVVWVLRTAGTAWLMEYDLAAGRSEILAELPGLQASGLAVLPGQDVYCYPRRGEIAGDLMLLRGWGDNP